VDEAIGVNDRVPLALAEQLLRRRILERHMYAGVTLLILLHLHRDSVQIGMDSVLYGHAPFGETTIGWRMSYWTCNYNSPVSDWDRCIVRNSVVEEAVLERCHMGPFSHCRPGAHLAHGVRWEIWRK